MTLKSNTFFGFLFLCLFTLFTACGQDPTLPTGSKPIGSTDVPSGADFLPTQATLNATTRAIRPVFPSFYTTMAWSPDKTKIALSTYRPPEYVNGNPVPGGSTQVYDAQTLTPLFDFNENSMSLHWSADSRELMGGSFSIWDTTTGQRLVHWDALKQFTFDPDGTYNDNYSGSLYRVIPSPNGELVAVIASKFFSSTSAGNLHPGSTQLRILNTRTGTLFGRVME
jgi:hypothetical protein